MVVVRSSTALRVAHIPFDVSVSWVAFGSQSEPWSVSPHSAGSKAAHDLRYDQPPDLARRPRMKRLDAIL